jgi:hypothetical protein
MHFVLNVPNEEIINYKEIAKALNIPVEIREVAYGPWGNVVPNYVGVYTTSKADINSLLVNFCKYTEEKLKHADKSTAAKAVQ